VAEYPVPFSVYYETPGANIGTPAGMRLPGHPVAVGEVEGRDGSWMTVVGTRGTARAFKTTGTGTMFVAANAGPHMALTLVTGEGLLVIEGMDRDRMSIPGATE
jgi:hypothetical protein